MQRASEIGATALNLDTKKETEPCDIDTGCMFCGMTIKKGDLSFFKPLKNKPFFMDDCSLALRNSQHACQFCSVFLKKGPLFKAMGTVFYKDGAYPILNDKNRTWFLLSPPEPPFVACIASQKSQHLIWRTPVTLDHEHIVVRLGNQLLIIRHSRLMLSVDLCSQAGEILTAHAEENKKKTTYSHPYSVLDRNLEDNSHGLFNPTALKISKDNKKMADILDYLGTCTLGETWALATLSKKKKEEPIKPEKIII